MSFDIIRPLSKCCVCRKLGISFWQYLKDRVEYQNKYPPLAEIMKSQMFQPDG